jgi:hypothetical protein
VVRILTDSPKEGVVVVRRLPPIFPEIGINSDKTPSFSDGSDERGRNREAGFIAVKEAKDVQNQNRDGIPSGGNQPRRMEGMRKWRS